jgi:hypothetical protein
MKEIDTLILEIDSSNIQMRLLAMNASIQARQAGAEGEGFSIIAHEVASLSKKGTSFVATIREAASNLSSTVMLSASARLTDAARDTMSKIDRNLFERYCDIQAWGTFSKLIEVVSTSRRSDNSASILLRAIHKIYEVYHDIYVLDLDGVLLNAAINQELIGKNFSTQEWFKIAASKTIYVSDIYHSETLNAPIMTFSAPIYAHNNKLVGVIASRFNCNYLNDIIKATIVGSTSKTYLLNNKGLVIASRNSEDVLNRNFKALFESIAPSPDSGNVEEKSTPGQVEPKYTVGYAHSRGYNTYGSQKWGVIIRCPNDS